MPLSHCKTCACPLAIAWRSSRGTAKANGPFASTVGGDCASSGESTMPMRSKLSTTTRRRAVTYKSLPTVTPGEVLPEELLQPLKVTQYRLLLDISLSP